MQVFKEWFKDQLFNLLDEPPTIIMDNASYHSVQIHNLQICPLQKLKLKTGYIQEHYVFAVRPELNESETTQYKLDEMAFEHGTQNNLPTSLPLPVQPH